MNEVFVDSGAFYAINDKSDQYFKKAKNTWSEILKENELITTDYIIEETASLIRKHLGIKQSIEFIKQFQQNKIIILHNITREIKEKAWEIFIKYNDKDYSFTDCTSFAFMKANGITKVFAFDDDFLHFGFELVTQKEN